jgi:hypothetical protein
MRKFFLTICLSALPMMAADIYTFSVSPAENVSGPAGLTLTGWGYTIHNESTSNWLVTTNLSAGTFLHATPDLLFDFPDLAPGATATAPYNPVPPGAGLYQLLWDQDAPPGFVNSGSFTLSAQWWNGDPTNGGSFASSAPDAIQPYSARLTATPEPATVGLACLIVLAIPFRRALRRGAR